MGKTIILTKKIKFYSNNELFLFFCNILIYYDIYIKKKGGGTSANNSLKNYY